MGVNTSHANNEERKIEAKIMCLMKELANLTNKKYPLKKQGAISGAFNAIVSKDGLMALFLQDRQQILSLEKWLAYYQRKLYSLRSQSFGAAPQMAA